ncbi:unnamed protein product, partial [marine sediment metagenome]
FTKLGADGPDDINDNDVIGIRCVGTEISFLLNGAVSFTRTDATHATGKAGIRIYQSNSPIRAFNAIDYVVPSTGFFAGKLYYQLIGRMG